MKSVVITGAATGMGLEMADIFAREGWRVFAAVLPGQNVDDLQSRNSAITVLRIDIANDELCRDGARAVEDAVGDSGLDLLINNAGVGNPGQGILESLNIADTRKLFDINVFGTMQITQALLPLLTKSGDAGIINFASGVVRVPLPFSMSYNMSKYAVSGFSNTLRYELANLGVKVTSIEPGLVRTPLTTGLPDGDPFEVYWSSQTAEIRDKYESWMRPMNMKTAGNMDNANEPEDIAQQVFDLTKKAKWKSRYSLGKDVKLLPLIQKLLPEGVFEAMIKKEFM